ncbi:monoglyceride lipase-like [Corticium candelabrum]|uniref:monoglyceride lipase-like n=1 Tax=Corticium candelabrum TaxID=121492 RepID=UPI002E26B69C|nr:monoglyceride lipase-like [Corticium candelabrum]
METPEVSSGSVPRDSTHFTNADGHKIYYRRWVPQHAPRAVLFLCHGVAEHIERYNPLASTLADKGILVVGNDHVGHGKSEGIRVDCRNFREYVRDLLQLVHMVKDEQPNIQSDIPHFLFGHSMGGGVAILAALDSPGLFSGVLLSAPIVIINPEQATSFKICLVRATALLFPQLHVGSLNFDHLSRDPEQVKAYINDPLVYTRGMKARWSLCALNALQEIEERLRDITWPYLLMHGSDDQLVLKEGSEMLHEKSQSEDKTLKIYPDYRHEILNEPKEYSDVVVNDIVSWLEERIS